MCIIIMVICATDGMKSGVPQGNAGCYYADRLGESVVADSPFLYVYNIS